MLVDFAGETPAEALSMVKEVMALGSGGKEYNVDWRWPDGMCDIDCYIELHVVKSHNKDSSCFFQHKEALSQFLFYMESRI